MKTFKEYINEVAGTFALVSCKDADNPNFQIWGAMSDMKCPKKKDRIQKMKFNSRKENSDGKVSKKQ